MLSFSRSTSSFTPSAFYQLGGGIWVGTIFPQIIFWLLHSLVFELALVCYFLRHLIWSARGMCSSLRDFFVQWTQFWHVSVGLLPRAAVAASTAGKRRPPTTAPWGWTTAKPLGLTACSGKFTTTLRTRTMMWAMPTPSKMISTPARWVSNRSLWVACLMTSSYLSSGRLRKTFTYRRSNWALRRGPGIRRCKASGVWGHWNTAHTAHAHGGL